MYARRLIASFKKEAYITPIILSLFLVPIFWNPSFIQSFTQGKEILFKSVTIITLILFASVLIYKKKYTFKNITESPILFLLLLQICIFAITNVFSNTPIVTLYGTYSRGFGFIIELFLFIFLIYCSLALSRKNIQNLLKIIFVSGLIVAAYAILQKIGFDPFFKNYDIGIFVGRVFSFSGNPSYLGQLMMLDIIIGGYFIFSERKISYIPGTLLLLAALFFSGTRTALLGLIVVAMLISIKYYRSFIKVIKKYKITVIIGLLFIGTIFTILPQDRYSLSDPALRSFNSRLEIWDGTIDLIKKTPLAGYGGETFYIYFPEIITKKFLTLEENLNTSADKIHNETLEIFFSHGAVAVLIYFVLLVFVFRIFFKSKNETMIILALIIIANTVQNQLAFPDITISILTTFCFAGLIALKVKNKTTIKIEKWKRCLLAPVLLVLSVYIGFFTIYKPYMSQLAYAKSHANYSNYAVAVNNHKAALAYTPYYSEPWYELIFIDPSSMERALFYLEQIEGESGNVLAWKGNFYSDKDPHKASKFYTKALEKNPYHPNWIRAFADMLYDKGDYENALYLYNQYLEAIPDFWKWTDDLGKHDEKEQKSYKTFFKLTPYFWGVIDKINSIISTPPQS